MNRTTNNIAVCAFLFLICPQHIQCMEQEQEDAAPITRPSFDDFKPVSGAETFTVLQDINGLYFIFENGTNKICGNLHYNESTITSINIDSIWTMYTRSITRNCFEQFEKDLIKQGDITISYKESTSTPTTLEILQQHGFARNKNGLYTKQLVTVRPVNESDLADPKIKAYLKAQKDFRNQSDSQIDAWLEKFHAKRTQQNEKGSTKFDGLVVIDKNSTLHALALYRIQRDPDIKRRQLLINELIHFNSKIGPEPIDNANNPLCVLLKALGATAQQEAQGEMLYLMPEKNDDKKIEHALKESDFKERGFVSDQWWYKKI